MAIPQKELGYLAENPQALVSAEAQAQLKGIFAGSGSQGTALFDQTILAMRHTLDMALSEVFVIAFLTILLAFIINFFLKEIPLRKGHGENRSAKL